MEPAAPQEAVLAAPGARVLRLLELALPRVAAGEEAALVLLVIQVVRAALALSVIQEQPVRRDQVQVQAAQPQLHGQDKTAQPAQLATRVRRAQVQVQAAQPQLHGQDKTAQPAQWDREHLLVL